MVKQLRETKWAPDVFHEFDTPWSKNAIECFLDHNRVY
jgi:hypothetical protein